MKRKRRKSLKSNRSGSAAARNRKRPARSTHGGHDYNLLEPRLLLVNYHFGDAPQPYPVTFADDPNVARHGTGTDSRGSTSDGEHSD